MGGGAAGGELAGRVSEAGGLGVVGASWVEPEQLRDEVERARELTDKPIGVNLLLFGNEALIEPALDLEPAVFSTAWPRDDQDLAAIFEQAHERGARVMHMVTTPRDAVTAVEAGADVIVAHGTEGGGHGGEIGTTVIPLRRRSRFGRSARARRRRRAPRDAVPRERGGERRAAREGCGRRDRERGHDPHERARLVLGPRLARGLVACRAVALRRGVRARVDAAYERGDTDQLVLWLGQSAGLVDAVEPAGEIVRRVVAESEEILRERLPALVR